MFPRDFGNPSYLLFQKLFSKYDYQVEFINCFLSMPLERRVQLWRARNLNCTCDVTIMKIKKNCCGTINVLSLLASRRELAWNTLTTKKHLKEIETRKTKQKIKLM